MFAAFSPQDTTADLIRQRLQAPKLADTLQELSHESAKILAHSADDFRSWGLCEHLITRSWHARFDSAQITLQFAELALWVGDQLQRDTYDERSIADLRGRTWTNLGNAHRIVSDYARSQECFEEASAELAQGTNAPVFRAELAHTHSQLFLYQGRFTPALELLRTAHTLYQEIGDEQAVADVALHTARTHGFSGDTQTAIDLLNETIPTINPQISAPTFYSAVQNLAFFYEEVGNVEKAVDSLMIVTSYYRDRQDALNVARIKWVQGKLARRAGNISLAEGLFLSARDTFIEQDIGFDAAEVSLHVADIYVSTCRPEALFQLAAEIVPIFECRDMHEHAARALVFLQTAIQTLTVDHMLIARLLQYLKRARFDTELVFLPAELG